MNKQQLIAENKELKDYCNALLQLVALYLPICPAKSRAMWAKALDRGRELAERTKAEMCWECKGKGKQCE